MCGTRYPVPAALYAVFQLLDELSVLTSGPNRDEDVYVHDFHATMLHLLGIDRERLSYRFQGRDFRLTDVQGNVVYPILA